MKPQELHIGNRAIVLTFSDPYLTNVCVVFGQSGRVFVWDTFVGSAPMNEVKRVITDEGHADRPIVVFNSHADYDHYWGNSSFENAMILAHELTYRRITAESARALTQYKEMARGTVEVVLPTATFSQMITFHGDGVTFFYSPGHTSDSASALDVMAEVLFVGDNVESPYPYVNDLNFAEYITTLKHYLEMEWDWLVAGHDPVMKDDSLVLANIEYLETLSSWSLDIEDMRSEEFHRHLHNLETLAPILVQEGCEESAVQHYREALSIVESQPENERFIPALRRVCQ
ncbi:MAG: MBL fold metallo-hydrolase [Candidatus Thorarchaeota archaeon]